MDPLADFVGQSVNLDGESSAVLDQCHRQSGDGPVELGQVDCYAVVGAGAFELARRHPARVQFVQMPAQPCDHTGAFGDDVLPVVDESPPDPAVHPLLALALSLGAAVLFGLLVDWTAAVTVWVATIGLFAACRGSGS